MIRSYSAIPNPTYFSSSDDFFSPLLNSLPFCPSFFSLSLSLSLSLFSFLFPHFHSNFCFFSLSRFLSFLSLSSLIFLRFLSCNSHLLPFSLFSLFSLVFFLLILLTFSPGFSLFHTHSLFSLSCFRFSP